MGKWNGFGGKVNSGETIEDATLRELYEETGLVAQSLNKIGTLDFQWQGKPDILEVHIFKTDKFHGNPTESEEMRPAWFHIDNIPFDDMWQDDKHWMPRLIFDQKFKGRFLFDDANSILDFELNDAKET